MTSAGLPRACVRLCLAAVLAVVIALPGCSRKGTDLLENPEVRSWKSFFFAEGAPVQDDGTMKFTCIPVPLPGDPEPGGGLVCNETGSVCLVVDTGYLREQGRVVRGEPDSSVSLYYPDGKSMCRFLSLGTMGCVHGGVWLSSRVFVVYGLAGEGGFLFRADIDEGMVRKYTVPASYRKPDAKEERYFTLAADGTDERGSRKPARGTDWRGQG
jgi:hypothetical protein